MTADVDGARPGTIGTEIMLATSPRHGARHAIDDAAKALRVELRQLREGDVTGGVALIETLLAVVESEDAS